MTKHIVFKKVSAYELQFVEGDSVADAIENVKEGKGITASDCQFLWQEDEHSDKWIVQPLVATDKELAVMRGISLPYATQWETGRGDEQC